MREIVKYCIRGMAFAAGIFAVALFSAACNNTTAEEFESTPHGIVSIAHLKTLCRNNSTTINEDISIEGYVVANDLFGEYQRAIILCDESAGIEISIDCKPTAIHFPISARIVVHCTGLAVGNQGGRIILGAAPSGSYTVNRIKESDIERYMLIDRTQPKEIKPQKMTIGQIDNDCVGNYIALDDVTFGAEAGLCWCDKNPETGEYITTYRTLHDRNGNTIGVRTIAECSYRAESIPSGYGSLWGMVERSSDEFVLRIVNHRIEFGKE